MKIKISDIRLFARYGAFQEGKQLFQEDRVSLLRATLKKYEASVADDHEIYHVRIFDRQPILQADCSCKANYYHHCAHIVAALLSAREFYQHHQAELAYQQTHPLWQNFVADITKEGPNHRSGQRRGARQWQILFQLHTRPASWTLVPYKVYIKKDGRFGRLLPLNSSEHDLSDAQFAANDPIVIAYLFQQKHWDYSTHLSDYMGYKSNHWDSFPYGGAIGPLFELLQDSVLFLNHEGELGQQLHFVESPHRIQFRFVELEDTFSFLPFLLSDSAEQPLLPPFQILTEKPMWLLQETRLLRIENLERADLLMPFSAGPLSLSIPKKELPDFLDAIVKKGCVDDALQLPNEYGLEEIRHFDEKRITLKEKDEHLEFVLSFTYHDQQVLFFEEATRFCRVLADRRVVLEVTRDTEEETRAWSALLESGLKFKPQKGLYLDEKKVIPWLFHSLPALTEAGFTIYGQEKLKKYKVRTATPNVHLAVSTEIDWFDLQLEIDFEGVALSLKELKRAISRDEKYVKLVDHSIGLLPEELIKKFQFLFHFASVEDRTVRLATLHVSLIDVLFEEHMLKNPDHGYRQKLARLKEFAGLREQPLPAHFQGTLRPYQKSGYDWLHFLREYGFGGCLADDMGLGKTVQALALLQKEKERGAAKPNLIVCPTSVVFNWEKEVQKFAPDLTVLVHTGMQRRQNLAQFNDHDIILTSYGLVLRDITFLKEQRFHYIILDESQKIKNPLSQTAKAVRLLTADHRLVLTGTPVENNTAELWSQFSFLNPGFLGSLASFRSFFALPIEKRHDEDTVTLLKRMIYPFVLRRSKELVETELPEKSEQIYYCHMQPDQARIYGYWRDYFRSVILQKIDQAGMDRARMNILEGLVKLRQISCHPKLVDRESTAESGKFEALKEMLEDILAEGHKVLIFSQFVKMLTVVRHYLDEQNIRYEYLDGHTVDRKTCVQHFQTDATVRVFLISLKAGGTGLNLTAADYVILYDPWWNPAVEMQATDRAHRIGQDKKVFVYRMISKDTVEEKMLELQERKRSLVANLISVDSGFFKSLTRQDIEALFS